MVDHNAISGMLLKLFLGHCGAIRYRLHIFCQIKLVLKKCQLGHSGSHGLIYKCYVGNYFPTYEKYITYTSNPSSRGKKLIYCDYFYYRIIILCK